LKGQDLLIQAFARIARGFPDLDLVIVGNRGPAEAELQSLVAALKLQERVRFYIDVPHPEVLAYFEQAIVSAFPSRSEGLPIAVLEAGFFRLPVVASRVGGIPEIINSAKVGILVEPDDDRALELALRRLLSDADQRALLGKRLQQRVAEEFTWHRAWQQYLGVLKVRSPAGFTHERGG
jgi:glycosyltransferase involved in cell wall biosynthesis